MLFKKKHRENRPGESRELLEVLLKITGNERRTDIQFHGNIGPGRRLLANFNTCLFGELLL
jgi:hypothetical protein